MGTQGEERVTMLPKRANSALLEALWMRFIFVGVPMKRELRKEERRKKRTTQVRKSSSEFPFSPLTPRKSSGRQSDRDDVKQVSWGKVRIFI